MTEHLGGYILHSIPGGWTIEEGNVRMFLLEGRERAVLIDTGAGGGDLRAIVEHLTSKPLRVILTHNHFDHLGALAQFHEAWIHPADRKQAAQACPAATLFPLEEGAEIDLGGCLLRVLHTPGHTPGSISLADVSHGCIYCGDNISDRPIFLCLPGNDARQYLQTLRRLIDLAEKNQLEFYTCHGTMKQGCDQGRALMRCMQKILRGELTPEPMVVYSGDTYALYTDQTAKILR